MEQKGVGRWSGRKIEKEGGRVCDKFKILCRFTQSKYNF